VQITELQTNLG